MKTLLLPLAAVAMTATPAMATAADVQRASQTSKEKAELGGSSVLVAILAAAAVIAGIVVAADGDDDEDLPVSI